MANVDMDNARSTYSFFISLLKWAVPVVALITAFVVLLIA